MQGPEGQSQETVPRAVSMRKAAMSSWRKACCSVWSLTVVWLMVIGAGRTFPLSTS